MNNLPIICDPGTGYMKMGYAGDNFPKATFASLVGRPMFRCQESLGEDVQLKAIMIGKEASKYRSLLELSYPTSQGIVKNWDDMKCLMEYSFAQIAANPVGASVFITEAIMNPTVNRVKMLEMMFEYFKVDRVQYGVQALMPLFAEGLMTAMLLDCGDGVSHCLPVYEGHLIKPSFERLEVAGRHVTQNLLKLLQMRGYAFNSTSDFETVRQIKEKLCFVSGDIKVDKKLALQTCFHDKEFVLPDGNKIKVGRERFEAPEILMNPNVAGLQLSGCGEMLFKSITSTDLDLRKQFYNTILISGGTSMLPGFPTRLKQQVQSLFNERVLKGASTSQIKIRVLDPPSRKYNVFIGASIIAHQSISNPDAWKTLREYKEKGSVRFAQELSVN